MKSYAKQLGLDKAETVEKCLVNARQSLAEAERQLETIHAFGIAKSLHKMQKKINFHLHQLGMIKGGIDNSKW